MLSHFLKINFLETSPSIKIIPIIEAQIKSTIHSLKKLSSYDEITSKILKAGASLISHSFSYIYYHSPYMAVFRVCLKIAVVKPPYKKGNKTSMTTYSPISLLMIFSKVLEKAMQSRLSYYLHANNILVTERYGCRKVVSTEDAALRLTDSVFKSVNEKCMLEEFL
jgi:hypothetical protein